MNARRVETIAGLLLAAAFAMGCPLEWGKNGFNDRAARSDIRRIDLVPDCPAGQHHRYERKPDCKGADCGKCEHDR